MQDDNRTVMAEPGADGQHPLSAKEMQAGYRSRVIIDGLSFDVCPGEILALIGPNGAGKSTILKAISMQLPVLGGKVYLGKDEIRALKPGERAKREAMVLTERIRPELMTARDVVEMGRYPFTDGIGHLTDKDREEVREAMKLMDVSDLAERNYNEMSDGQKQRVLIARAIAQTPKVMLLDEPTSYLDIRYKLALLRTLQKLTDERKTAVIATLHEVELALSIADRILCVKDGHAFFTGTPEEVRGEHLLARLFDVDPEDRMAAGIYPWLLG